MSPEVVARIVKLNAKPSLVEIDLNKTALVVVDMQNAFVSKGGMLDDAGYDLSRASVVIGNNAKLLPALRKAGVKIVYLKMSYSADYSDAGGPRSPNPQKELGLVLMREHPERAGKYVTEGTWDEAIHQDLLPQPGDVVVRKQRYSGFAGTNLDLVLKTSGVQYCLYAGVATNVCVESTLRDGYFLDYWPILIADACNHSGPEHNRLATEWNAEHVFGWLTNTADVLEALGATR